MALGCYREPYLPASFKGVPFVAVEVTSEHGRRGAEGEFPFGENTAYADLGRRIRTYSLQGRLQSNAHVIEAAALIAACETPGPGILVHPTRGVVTAACRSLRVSDRIEDEQGVTYVDMDFVEANEWPNGLSLVGSLIGLAIGSIINASRETFRDSYRPRESQIYYRDSVSAVAQAAVGQVRQGYEVATRTSANLDTWRALADLQEVEESKDLVTDVAVVDRALTLGMNALASSTSEDEKFKAFRSLANWAAQSSRMSGVAGESVDAIYSHMRILSAAYMGHAGMEMEFATMGDAFAALDAVTTILEDEARIAYGRCDNGLFMEIRKFLTDVQAQLYRKAYELPRLIEFDFSRKVHPLVAAYSIFGDAKKHRELERSNIVSASGRVGPQVAAVSA